MKINNFNSDCQVERRKPGFQESQIYRWSGLKDCADSFAAFRKKEYMSSAQSFGIACLKIGTISAAAFGVYKWFSSETVYLQDFMKQAEDDFKQNANSSVAPSSVEKMTHTYYYEYKNFSQWPVSAKDFFKKHLAGSALMSSAIVTHLLTEGAKRKDVSFEKFAVDTCRSEDVSSKSCMAVLDSLTGTASAKSLDTAMKISGRCQKNSAFCKKALTNAQTQSVDQQEMEKIKTLAQRMTRRNALQENGVEFLQKATELFSKQFQEFEKEIHTCQEAKKNGGVLDTAACFSKASIMQKGRILFGKENFLQLQEQDAVKKLKNALSEYGLALAKACADFSQAGFCPNFRSDILRKLLAYDLVDEAFGLLLKKGPLQETEVSLLIEDMTKNKQWSRGGKLLEKLKSHKFSLNAQAITNFQQKKDATLRLAQSALTKLLSNPSKQEMSDLIDQAFSIQTESHLNAIFEAALSWVPEHYRDCKNADYRNKSEALKLVVQKFFDLDTCDDPIFGCRGEKNRNAGIAKTIVTDWIDVLSKGNLGWYYKEHIPLNGEYYSYYKDVSKSNWKQKIESYEESL